MPVIVVLTKVDTLSLPAFKLLKEQGLSGKEAMPRVADGAAQIQRKLQGNVENQLNSRKYPPKDYVPMASKL